MKYIKEYKEIDWDNDGFDIEEEDFTVWDLNFLVYLRVMTGQSNITTRLKDSHVDITNNRLNNSLIYEYFEYYEKMYSDGEKPTDKDIEWIKLINSYVNKKYHFSYTYRTLDDIRNQSYRYDNKISYTIMEKHFKRNFLS